jgi:biopolymer transport protein ExbD
MAGTQSIGEASDNPVGINVTAMVDIIFCLIIFFMCSFHFKQLEGKVETWLPKTGGFPDGPPPPIVLEEVRVFLRWNPETQSTLRAAGNRGPAASDEALMASVLGLARDWERVGKREFPVIQDATPDVPWRDVIHVMDLCKREKLDRIELTEPVGFRERAQAH